MPALGCPTAYTARVTDPCGDAIVCQLDELTTVEWTRELSGVSTATITIAEGVGCCSCAASSEPVCQSLEIFRDGVRVWGPGPIFTVTVEDEEGVTITASDMLLILASRHLTRSPEFTGTPVEIARTLIDEGLEVNNPCPMLFHELTVPGRDEIPQSYLSWDNNILALVDALTDLRIGYTHVLDHLWLFDLDAMPALGVLLTKDSFIGGFTLTKAGGEYFSYVRVNGAAERDEAGNFEPGSPVAEADAGDCGFRIERLITDSDITTVQEAQKRANDLADSGGGLAPRFLETDGGLSPDAPVSITDLIPGVLVPVSATVGCDNVVQALRLRSLEVTWSAATLAEEVSVTLSSSPLGRGGPRNLSELLAEIALQRRAEG